MIYELFVYKGKPIFAGEITLRVYPEAIFAEKLETVVSKGVINSRMKDYHDLIVMIREPDFLAIDKLGGVIHATFVRRGTDAARIPPYAKVKVMNQYFYVCS
jgi:Nucleotidyl transferase AbiEii toxin, Type IV TA system